MAGTDSITIWLPLVEPQGDLTRALNVKWSSQPAFGWAAILAGLVHRKATMASGKPVKTVSHAVRYVGEQAAGISADSEKDLARWDTKQQP